MVPVWIARGQSVAAKFKMPLKVWLVGIAGPWGYSACFFTSYQLITPVHANLLLLSWPVCYSWPTRYSETGASTGGTGRVR